MLNTQGFKESEVEKASQELKEKFDLKTWVGKNKNKPVIKISGEDYEKFLELSNEYIIDAMKYKLPTPRVNKPGVASAPLVSLIK